MTHATSARSIRNIDRTVRDLETTISRKDKQNAALEDEISKSRDRLERLLATIDELQSSESDSQLAVRRAERELKEEREKRERLEREMEGWRNLRVEKGGTISSRSGLSTSMLSALAEDNLSDTLPRPGSALGRDGADSRTHSRSNSRLSFSGASAAGPATTGNGRRDFSGPRNALTAANRLSGTVATSIPSTTGSLRSSIGPLMSAGSTALTTSPSIRSSLGPTSGNASISVPRRRSSSGGKGFL
jgi:hypothetical protein